MNAEIQKYKNEIKNINDSLTKLNDKSIQADKETKKLIHSDSEPVVGPCVRYIPSVGVIKGIAMGVTCALVIMTMCVVRKYR